MFPIIAPDVSFQFLIGLSIGDVLSHQWGRTVESKAKKILVYEPRTSGSPESNEQLCSAALPNIANTPQEIISVLKFWFGKIKFILFEQYFFPFYF